MNPTSVDGNCGSTSKTNATCLTSVFGNCCSEKGFCGASIDYCGDGCQPAHGSCNSASTQTISTTGSCGATATSNLTCLGSTYGNCCSSLGYCGGNSSYCGDGCQSGLGSCVGLPVSVLSSITSPTSSTSLISSTLSSATPSITIAVRNGTVSVDGNCGPNSMIQAICLGSTFGDCCSARGYCGKTSDYCATGCQPLFGNCDQASSSSTSKSILSTADVAPATATNLIPTSNRTNLSTGAKAGIGAGSAAAGIVILAVLGFVIFRFLRNKKRHEIPSTKTGPMVHHVPGLHEVSEGAGGVFEPVEMPVTQTRQQRAILKQKNREEKERRESERRARVDDRAAAGYEGAYRGN